MSHEVGEVFEVLKEFQGIWQIPNFRFLPVEVDKGYSSPKFTFWGSCWCLTIYPGGKTGSTKWMSVYLQRMDYGSPKNLHLEIKLSYRSHSLQWGRDDLNFSTTPESLGFNEFLPVSTLNQMKYFYPSDELTFKYYLKESDYVIKVPAFCSRLLRRAWDVNQALAGIFGEENADVKLKLQDGEIPAHKAVLKSRSPVFSRMFDVDMSESETGEVNIEDATVDVFRVVLSYAYTGYPKGLDDENAMDVYRLADKYEFEDLQNLCIEVLKHSVTPDTICDVFAFADLFQEVTLKKRVVAYFSAIKAEVLKGEKWKNFKRDYSQIAVELLQGSLELS